MNGMNFLKSNQSRWVFVALLVGGVWLGCFAEGECPSGWAAEAKAPASKAAPEADVPDMPAEGEKPAVKESDPSKPEVPAPKSAKQPTEKGAEKPSAPVSKEKEKDLPESKPAEKTPEAPKPKGPSTELGTPPGKEKAPTPVLEWPVNEEQRKYRSEVPKMLRGGTLNAEQVKLLTEYYTQYGLARWTVEANRADVRKFREELLRELREAENPAHDQALKIVMDLLVKMAEGNHAPVARVNAVLALGELNRVEPKPTKPAEPLPEMQPILLRFLQNPDTPDALRVAALVGVRRHVELGAVAEPVKLQTATLLAGMVQQRTPSGKSAAAHTWLRVQAMEVLELLKTPGPNGQVAQVLIEVLADTTNPLGVRASAARALGNLDYSQGFPGDLSKTLREIGQTALDALDTELETYKKEKKLVARRLQTHLIGVYNGLSGLQKVASSSPDAAALHQKILDAVRACLLPFENPKLRDTDGKLLEADVVQELMKHKGTLTSAVSAPVASPSPAQKTK
ncbi:MAG TPA: hypothetical protein PLQ00_00780 [Thermoguttaceae bacterium]|nr:hypothetical protein [Thermoguttaceae bacterium]